MNNDFLACIYTYSYNSAAPISAMAAGLIFSLFKYSEYIQSIHLSNTNLIIKQNDQIQFLLKRIIDLNKKIDRMHFDYTILSTSSTFLDEEKDVDKDVDKDIIVKENIIIEEVVEENIVENLQANVIENNFEIIETEIDDKLNKKKSWFRPFF
jgi:hypothetical protein